MSAAPDIAPVSKADSPAAKDTLSPVIRPRKGAFQLLREVLDHGGPGYLQKTVS